uniref:Uncharacterized protein n=1 Tax=Romanomermis culicivorax TaxID=13658 RepID=A0A915JNI3_ROMCU
MRLIHTSSTLCGIDGNAVSLSNGRRYPIANLYMGETGKLSSSMSQSVRLLFMANMMSVTCK